MRYGEILSVLVVSITLYGCSAKHTAEQLFEALDPAITGLTFINKISDTNERLSVVDYLYYYNGAGIAAGDINNDGLTDLFFVSNENNNTLYLNKGNFQFEDISVEAGIQGFAEWKTGVTMADVNGDGFLDIYVCALGDFRGLEGSNELYINNGDATFSERSSEYGLDLTGLSTQAAFFDYDHDGDLDMYLVTYARHTSRSYDKIMASLLPEGSAVDYLFRNDHGTFTDVSAKAGIREVPMGYGMGIAVADINNDGWEDIYVTNDFAEEDHCYINNGDGTFCEEGRKRFGHFSRFSKGCDIADMNNDGYEDIMTVDMYPSDEYVEKTSHQDEPWEVYDYKRSYGNHHQFSRNSLHVNNGGINFSDWGLMSGVYATDWSWSPLLADYNNDGYKDIFITNGVARRLNDLEYLRFSHKDSMRYVPKLTTDQIRKAIQSMPEGKTYNVLYEGGKDLKFQDRSEAWGMRLPGLSTGAVYADLDNDGDLDLVTSNINAPATVYRNRANDLTKNNFVSVELRGPDQNRFGVGAKIYLKTKDGFQMQHVMPTRGFLSSVDHAVHFGIGKNVHVDTLMVRWNDQRVQVLTDVAINNKIRLRYQDAGRQDIKLSLYPDKKPVFEDVTLELGLTYVHKENKYSDFHREGLMPFLVSTEGPRIATGDVNGDGREDLFIGGAKHQAGAIYLQKSTGGFNLSVQPALQKDSVYEDVDAMFLDIDQDDDLDLYVVSGGNEFYGTMDKQFDRVYRNDGKGNLLRDTAALPPMYDNKSCVRPYDVDNDGDLDLFVGGRVVGYHYGKYPRSYLLINDGKGNFSDEISGRVSALANIGMVTDAVWTDTDGDGDADLVVTGDWMPVRIFENMKGVLQEMKDVVDPASPIKAIHGLWQRLVAADFDRDGDMDLMAGNLGMNTKLRKNNERSMLKLYAADLDQDQQQDHILAYNRPDGKFYSASSKDEWEKQMPGLTEMRFDTYDDFAGKSIEVLFSIMKIKLPEALTVDQFASLYFENTGKKTFIPKILPAEAQLSKIFSLCPGDFNGDGNTDVLVAGNYNGAGPYQGLYDASHGYLMKGDGEGNFTTGRVMESGLNLDGQVRDIKPIKTPSGIIYLVAKNGAPMQAVRTTAEVMP